MFRHLFRGFASSGRVSINHLKKAQASSGDENVVIGWVRKIRKMKNKSFLEVSDGSCSETLQLVVASDAFPNTVSIDTCIRAFGQPRLNPQNSGIEFAVKELTVVGSCDSANYPLNDRSSVDTERHWMHLRPQSPSFGAILRLRHLLEYNIRSAYHDLGYFNVHTPLMTRMDCEGGGETFQIHNGNQFFDAHPEAEAAEGIHLTVSSQLHLEAAMNGLSKVFTMSPAWRAEKSLTRHHLAEFYMVEAETVDANCVSSLCAEAETLLQRVAISFLNSECTTDLELLERKFKLPKMTSVSRIESFASMPIQKVSFDEALKILLEHSSFFIDSTPTPSTVDFSKEQEFFLTKHFGNRPVFITNFPSHTKPMYCSVAADGTAEAVDLLLPMVGEVLGGSVRENDFQRLKERMLGISANLPQSLEWYLDLRRFGAPPHGGYGFGFDRLLQFFIGVPNIRDIVPFPRHYKSCRL